MKNIEYGVSFGAAIVNLRELKEMDKEKFKIVEIPFGKYADDYKIYKELIKRNLKVGLHMPSSYSFQRFKFYQNIICEEQVDEIISYVHWYLSHDIKPKYFLVHVPLPTKGSNKDQVVTINTYYVKKLSMVLKPYKIPLYLENVAANHHFYQWRCFGNLFDKNIKMCFDIGHAHTIQQWIKESMDQDVVSDYFDCLNEYIECIHLYNVTAKSSKYKNLMHYPFIPIFGEEEGFMNYNNICNKINTLKNLKYIIFEPHYELYKEYGSFGNRLDMELDGE